MPPWYSAPRVALFRPEAAPKPSLPQQALYVGASVFIRLRGWKGPLRAYWPLSCGRVVYNSKHRRVTYTETGIHDWCDPARMLTCRDRSAFHVVQLLLCLIDP